MHVVCLVAQPEKYIRTRRREEGDLRLDEIRLEYDEWLRILFDLFDDHFAFDDAVRTLFLDRKRYLALTTPLSGYPLFSRISDFIGDAVFKLDELDLLKQECSDLLSRARDPAAMSGLQKLLKICDLGLESRRSVVFVGK